jgi:purine catabolism regulator
MVLILPTVQADAVHDASRSRLTNALEHVVSAPTSEQERLICGISDCADRAEELPRLYREAQQALDVGTRITRYGNIVAYRDLGIYRLLLQIGDERHLSRFVEETLGPLIRYDAAHKLGLVQTLSVFLNQRESLKQAARRLHVHANTVTYRLQRIEQLIPLDLSNPDDRLVAHVAVKILDFQHVAASGRR